MDKKFMRLGIRLAMVGIVIGSIWLFLYSPSFIHSLYREKSINVLVWPTELDAQYVAEFEKKTGIKVYISYIETNEELFVKMRASQGLGYDLIMPSNYAVELMVHEGLLSKIDKSKLKFFDQLYPALLNHDFDPYNEYTIPYFWDIYGLGINKNYFNGQLPEASWGLVFDKDKVIDKVGMIEDHREIILIATKYLCGDIINLKKQGCRHAVQKLLHKQKEWVAVYTDMRISYLLASETVPVSIALMTDLTRLSHEHPEIVFQLPKEGSFAIIDSFAIPRGNDKQEYVYEFLNYLYTPEVLGKYINKYDLFSPMKGVYSTDVQQELVVPTEEMFKNIDFYYNVVDEKTFDEMWINIIS